jgi:hypothetical protein
VGTAGAAEGAAAAEAEAAGATGAGVADASAFTSAEGAATEAEAAAASAATGLDSEVHPATTAAKKIVPISVFMFSYLLTSKVQLIFGTCDLFITHMSQCTLRTLRLQRYDKQKRVARWQ